MFRENFLKLRKNSRGVIQQDGGLKSRGKYYKFPVDLRLVIGLSRHHLTLVTPMESGVNFIVQLIWTFTNIDSQLMCFTLTSLT